MMNTHNNFYIITGGPGSGKTTLIEAIKNAGHQIIEEIARQIIQEQTKMNGDALHTKNQLKFRDLMLSRSIATFINVKEAKKPIFSIVEYPN